jgi:type II secretory pathway pseudopilin PulG
MSQRSGRFRNAILGISLVEVMVSFAIFGLAASGVLASLIQARKVSASNLSQSYAQSTAQSVIEQIVSLPPNTLADATTTTAEIKLATLTDNNFTELSDFVIPWATDSDDFTDLGVDAVGVLTDAAYVADAGTIRPERYMRMMVNLQRDIQFAEGRVHIVLRYRWAIPDRLGNDGDPIYLEGRITTIRSMALRF